MKTLRFKKTQFRSGVTKLDVFFFFPQFFRNPVSPIDVLFPLVDWLIEGFNKPLCHNRFLWWCRWYTSHRPKAIFTNLGHHWSAPARHRHRHATEQPVIVRWFPEVGTPAPRRFSKAWSCSRRTPLNTGTVTAKSAGSVWEKKRFGRVWMVYEFMMVYVDPKIFFMEDLDGLCWSKDFLFLFFFRETKVGNFMWECSRMDHDGTPAVALARQRRWAFDQIGYVNKRNCICTWPPNTM